MTTLKIPLERRIKRTGRTEKPRIWEVTDRTVHTWLVEAVEAAASGRRGDVLRASDAAHVPSLLRPAHAVRRYTTKGAAEFNGTQVDQLDGSVYEGLCTRCGRQIPGSVPDARCQMQRRWQC